MKLGKNVSKSSLQFVPRMDDDTLSHELSESVTELLGIRIIPIPPPPFFCFVSSHRFSIQSWLSLLLRMNLISFSSLMVMLAKNSSAWIV